MASSARWSVSLSSFPPFYTSSDQALRVHRSRRLKVKMPAFGYSLNCTKFASSRKLTSLLCTDVAYLLRRTVPSTATWILLSLLYIGEDASRQSLVWNCGLA